MGPEGTCKNSWQGRWLSLRTCRRNGGQPARCLLRCRSPAQTAAPAKRWPAAGHTRPWPCAWTPAATNPACRRGARTAGSAGVGDNARMARVGLHARAGVRPGSIVPLQVLARLTACHHAAHLEDVLPNPGGQATKVELQGMPRGQLWWVWPLQCSSSQVCMHRLLNGATQRRALVQSGWLRQCTVHS